MTFMEFLKAFYAAMAALAAAMMLGAALILLTFDGPPLATGAALFIATPFAVLGAATLLATYVVTRTCSPLIGAGVGGGLTFLMIAFVAASFPGAGAAAYCAAGAAIGALSAVAGRWTLVRLGLPVRRLGA